MAYKERLRIGELRMKGRKLVKNNKTLRDFTNAHNMIEAEEKVLVNGYLIAHHRYRKRGRKFCCLMLRKAVDASLTGFQSQRRYYTVLTIEFTLSR